LKKPGNAGLFYFRLVVNSGKVDCLIAGATWWGARTKQGVFFQDAA